MNAQLKPRRTKKIIDAMMPVRKWLTVNEGASFMGMHENTLREVINDNELTLSIIGKKQYVKVSELEGLIEESIFRKK
jgi:hypothetical protein